MTTRTDERRVKPRHAHIRTRRGVLQVITSTHRRGAEVFAVDLAEELKRRGRHVTTVALVSGTGVTLDVPALGSHPLAPKTLFALRRLARRSTIVLAHGSSAVVATALATIATGTPFVYRNIGDPSFWIDTPKRQRRMRWILRRAAAVVALWEGSEAHLRRIGPPSLDVRVIPKGVPARRFPPISTEVRSEARRKFGVSGLTAIYVGSLTPEKNVAAAISAIALVADACLLVVGDGPNRKELTALAREVAPGRVVFTGSLANPGVALGAADVLVLPSFTEGIPGVLIEAAYSELPVVATSVGGIRGVVDDGRTGILVAEPEPAALAAAIRAAARAGRTMGHAGRRWCQDRFEIGVIGGQWDELLAELDGWTAPR